MNKYKDFCSFQPKPLCRMNKASGSAENRRSSLCNIKSSSTSRKPVISLLNVSEVCILSFFQKLLWENNYNPNFCQLLPTYLWRCGNAVPMRSGGMGTPFPRVPLGNDPRNLRGLWPRQQPSSIIHRVWPSVTTFDRVWPRLTAFDRVWPRLKSLTAFDRV